MLVVVLLASKITSAGGGIEASKKCFGIIGGSVIRHVKMLGLFQRCESETPFKTKRVNECVRGKSR
jgi:hypothetical protein